MGYLSKISTIKNWSENRAVVLHVDLDQITIVETPDPKQQLFGTGVVKLRKLVKTINAAAEDKTVRGLVFTSCCGGNFKGLANITTLRNAILDFRETAGSRAPTYIHAEAFGGMPFNCTAVYYFASAFEHISTQPSSVLSVQGFGTSMLFFKNILEKYKAKAISWHREEYKSAINFLTESDYTEPQKQNVDTLLGEFITMVKAGISKDRAISTELLQETFDKAPISPEKALEIRLIDNIQHTDQVITQATTIKGLSAKRNPVKLIPILDYMSTETKKTKPITQLMHKSLLRTYTKVTQPGGAGRKAAKKAAKGTGMVAVIELDGQILQKVDEDSNSIGQKEPITSMKVVPLLDAVHDLPQVKAVVLRVNSPGGSAVASEAIYRSVARLREAGKTVIASMGNVAASGGYYIACPADKIYAQPTTITGSIGVIAAYIWLKDAFDDQGITSNYRTTNKNSLLFEPFVPLTDEQYALMDESVGDMYDAFRGRVGSGRGMDDEAVRKVAKGYVWTGKSAKGVGLVDELGSLEDAIEAAQQAVDSKKPDDVNVVYLPMQKSPIQAILELIFGSKKAPNPLQMSTNKHVLLTHTVSQISRQLRPVLGGGGGMGGLGGIAGGSTEQVQDSMQALAMLKSCGVATFCPTAFFMQDMQ